MLGETGLFLYVTYLFCYHVSSPGNFDKAENGIFLVVPLTSNRQKLTAAKSACRSKALVELVSILDSHDFNPRLPMVLVGVHSRKQKF